MLLLKKICSPLEKIMNPFISNEIRPVEKLAEYLAERLFKNTDTENNPILNYANEPLTYYYLSSVLTLISKSAFYKDKNIFHKQFDWLKATITTLGNGNFELTEEALPQRRNVVQHSTYCLKK